MRRIVVELARYREIGAAGIGSFSEPGDWQADAGAFEKAEAELRAEIEDGAATGRVIKHRLLERGIETARKKLQKRG